MEYSEAFASAVLDAFPVDRFPDLSSAMEICLDEGTEELGDLMSDAIQQHRETKLSSQAIMAAIDEGRTDELRADAERCQAMCSLHGDWLALYDAQQQPGTLCDEVDVAELEEALGR